MSKKEKSKKNVFGLVSKLGNLIKGTSSSNNSDNMDTSAGENEFPKKNFNIHISEDNQEQIDLGDEEEEEEEEEENSQEEKKESKNVNQIKNDNDEKKENIEIKDENKNIDKEIKNNENKINDEILIDEKDKNKKEEISENIKKENIDENDKNEEIKENNIENKEINENNKKEEMKEDIKKEEKRNEKEDKIKEENNIKNNIEKIEEKNNNIIKEEDNKESKETNNIINENNNMINIDNNEEKTNGENITKKEETTDITELNIEEEDITETCHIYLKPGNDFNSKEMYCLPISKLKLGKKKSLFQKINVFKKAKTEIINYKIFFEDNFIYFANDIIIDKNDDTMRRINKIYNIRNILNYTSNKDEENKKYKIMIEIMNKKNIKKSKEYLIEEQYFKEFNDELIKKLKLYGDKLIKNEK